MKLLLDSQLHRGCFPSCFRSGNVPSVVYVVQLSRVAPMKIRQTAKFKIMGNPQNYQELVQKVTMYLDNELNQDAERALLKEIKANPAYYEVLSKERSFRDFIKSRVHRRKVSPALIQSIKDKIKVAPAFNE